MRGRQVLVGGAVVLVIGLLAGCSSSGGRSTGAGGSGAQGVTRPAGASSSGSGAPAAALAADVTSGGGGSGVDSTGITARGLGRVSGTPDVLTFSIGVQVQAGKAGDALAQSSQKAQAVIDSLKGHGVADKDIQTSQLSLWPQYNNGGNFIVGYQASDMLTAKLRKLSDAGAAIDAAVTAAGDAGRVEGVQFTIDDQSPLMATARTDAVQRAHDQAAQLAQAAGVKLGALRSLTETTSDAGPLLSANRAAATAGGVAAGTAAVPVQPGSQELDVEVVAVYDIG